MYNPIATFQKGADKTISYPNRVALISGVDSPAIGKTHGVPKPARFGTDEFAESLDEVIEVRDMVVRDIWPADFLSKHYPWEEDCSSSDEVPEILRQIDIDEADPQAAAYLVQMDNPADLGNYSFDWLVGQGVPFANAQAKDFLDTRIQFNKILWDAIQVALAAAFEVKYYYGQPRPEEVVGLPGCLFTSYDEGCPKHPAYIAGHGTVAGVTVAILEKLFNFDNHPDQLADVKIAAYHFAQYRTFAGVHYAEDNIEGLKLGYKLAK